MTKVEILQREIQRLKQRVEKLEQYERPRFGTDMTADRIERLNERIERHQALINANVFDASASRVRRECAPVRRLRSKLIGVAELSN